MQIKTIDKNGNITRENQNDGTKNRDSRGFGGRKKSGKPAKNREDNNSQRQKGQKPQGQKGNSGKQERKEPQGQKGGSAQQERKEAQGRRDVLGSDGQEPEKNSAGRNRKKDSGRRKNATSRNKDIYDRDNRIWIQYQHYGTDDLSATVTISKDGDRYFLSKITVTAVGGKLMDLWHVPTFTEGLDSLADMEEFDSLAMKLRIAKKLHREGAPAVDESFACVLDNETDYVMFPGGCPDNDELSAQAERFVNDLGLKVARLCNPQEAMKGYGYL